MCAFEIRYYGGLEDFLSLDRVIYSCNRHSRVTVLCFCSIRCHVYICMYMMFCRWHPGRLVRQLSHFLNIMSLLSLLTYLLRVAS